MNLSSAELTTDALTKLGVLVFGQAPTTDLLVGGRQAANDMIDGWLVDELLVYAVTPDLYTLTSALRYTIGPTGDFVAARPTRIIDANYVFTNSNPVVRKPIAILTEHQWSTIGVQDINNAVVNALWYEGNFTQPDGNGTIHVWPGAPAGNLLELFTWKQLQSFADNTTVYGFPPAYPEAMKWGVAEKLIPMVRRMMKYDPATTIAMVRDQAQKAKTALQGYNAVDIFTECDDAYLAANRTGGAWDFRSGQFGRTGTV